MIPQKEAQKSLEKIKKTYNKELPVIVQLSKMQSISDYSKLLIHNRISIHKYNDRYALKRIFYKPITIQYPINEKR